MHDKCPLPREGTLGIDRACSELKVYFLLDCSDVWEIGPKLVFRGSDPPLVFFDMCFFACVVNSSDSCSSFVMFMFRK